MKLIYLPLLAFLVSLIFACKKPDPNPAVVKNPPRFVYVTLELGEQHVSHSLIELSHDGGKSYTTKGFSSSIDRDFQASISICYVGPFDLSNASKHLDDGSKKGDLIMIHFAAFRHENDETLFADTLYVKFTGEEQLILDRPDYKISIRNIDPDYHNKP